MEVPVKYSPAVDLAHEMRQRCCQRRPHLPGSRRRERRQHALKIVVERQRVSEGFNNQAAVFQHQAALFFCHGNRRGTGSPLSAQRRKDFHSAAAFDGSSIYLIMSGKPRTL